VAAARAEPRKGDGWAECALPATSALVSRALRPSSVQLQCDEDAKGACLLGAGRSAWELYLVTPEPSDLSVGDGHVHGGRRRRGGRVRTRDATLLI